MTWIAARLLPRREQLALRCLALAGFATYLPRLRERRTVRGRKVDATPALFPGYLFVTIEQQWRAARWAPGVAGLIMDGVAPARVPDRIIEEIRRREIGGLIELPRLEPGDRVKVTRGPFSGLVGLYAGMKPHERVEVLLSLLGGAQRVELAANAIEFVPRSDV